MNKQLIRLLVIFLAVLIGSGLLVYLLLERTRTRETIVQQPSATSAQSPSSTTQPGEDSIVNELFGLDRSEANPTGEIDRGVVAARVLMRFVFAAFFAVLLAYRWRRGLPINKRNPYVAQTQILLAVVAAAMMMIVGDSAARAFGIFAAASLVRFRTNIRDPKETTVLLICLGVGLACGVGRLELALILTLFSLVALWILEFFEARQVYRVMEVHVETRHLDQTHAVLKRVFEKHECSYELRQLERAVEDGENSKIVYELSLGSASTPDKLSDEILADDATNIAGLEWEQKKNLTYVYN